MSAPQQPSQQPPAPPAEKKRRLSFNQIVGLVLLAVAVVFIVENTDEVPVRLIGPKVHTPLYVALLIAAVLGALGAALLRHRRKNRKD